MIDPRDQGVLVVTVQFIVKSRLHRKIYKYHLLCVELAGHSPDICRLMFLFGIVVQFVVPLVIVWCAWLARETPAVNQGVAQRSRSSRHLPTSH